MEYKILRNTGNVLYRALVGPKNGFISDVPDILFLCEGMAVGSGIVTVAFPEIMPMTVTYGIFAGGVRAANELLRYKTHSRLPNRRH